MCVWNMMGLRVFFEKGRQIHCLKSGSGRLLPVLPMCLFIFFSIAYSLALHDMRIIQARDRGLMLLKPLKHLVNTLMRATQCNSVFSWQGAYISARCGLMANMQISELPP